MRKGDYVEVTGGDYRYTQIGSLGKVRVRRYDDVIVTFDYLAGDPERTYADEYLTNTFEIHQENLTKIPKAIYDIKLKAIQGIQV